MIKQYRDEIHAISVTVGFLLFFHGLPARAGEAEFHDLFPESTEGKVATATAAPGRVHRAFVTSEKYRGNFGKPLANGLRGAAKADHLVCGELAAHLGGHWQAILSDRSAAANQRILVGRDVQTLNGSFVADGLDDFWDGLLNGQINRNQFGIQLDPTIHTTAWTGSTAHGDRRSTQLEENCYDWTSMWGSHRGAAGLPAHLHRWWLYRGRGRCSTARRIYCLETGLHRSVRLFGHSFNHISDCGAMSARVEPIFDLYLNASNNCTQENHFRLPSYTYANFTDTSPLISVQTDDGKFVASPRPNYEHLLGEANEDELSQRFEDGFLHLAEPYVSTTLDGEDVPRRFTEWWLNRVFFTDAFGHPTSERLEQGVSGWVSDPNVLFTGKLCDASLDRRHLVIGQPFLFDEVTVDPVAVPSGASWSVQVELFHEDHGWMPAPNGVSTLDATSGHTINWALQPEDWSRTNGLAVFPGASEGLDRVMYWARLTFTNNDGSACDGPRVATENNDPSIFGWEYEHPLDEDDEPIESLLIVPGWDPERDCLRADGYISDEESQVCPGSSEAGARFRWQARAPSFYGRSRWVRNLDESNRSAIVSDIMDIALSRPHNESLQVDNITPAPPHIFHGIRAAQVAEYKSAGLHNRKAYQDDMRATLAALRVAMNAHSQLAKQPLSINGKWEATNLLWGEVGDPDFPFAHGPLASHWMFQGEINYTASLGDHEARLRLAAEIPWGHGYKAILVANAVEDAERKETLGITTTQHQMHALARYHLVSTPDTYLQYARMDDEPNALKDPVLDLESFGTPVLDNAIFVDIGRPDYAEQEDGDCSATFCTLDKTPDASAHRVELDGVAHGCIPSEDQRPAGATCETDINMMAMSTGETPLEEDLAAYIKPYQNVGAGIYTVRATLAENTLVGGGAQAARLCVRGGRDCVFFPRSGKDQTPNMRFSATGKVDAGGNALMFRIGPISEAVGRIRVHDIEVFEGSHPVRQIHYRYFYHHDGSRFLVMVRPAEADSNGPEDGGSRQPRQTLNLLSEGLAQGPMCRLNPDGTWGHASFLVHLEAFDGAILAPIGSGRCSL